VKLRALIVALCAAALLTAVAMAQGASGAGRESASSSSGAAEAVAARRLTARERRIRRYCRRARRRMRMHRETRRQARKRRRLCSRRRSGKHPAVSPSPTPTPAPAPVQPGTTAPTQVPLASYVSVHAREFYFTLSRPLVGQGQITIELRNNGEDPHNLVVSPDGTHDRLVSFADHDPGDVSSTNVTLPAGRYYLWCSLEGHEAAGMHATLKVE
jgi:plastocyanin